DTQMIRDAIQRAVTERTSCSFEHRVTRPDGSEIVVREVSDIVFDPASGKPVKMVGTIQDITEQKQAEHVLRGYQARLDLALNMAKAAYWDVDLVADTHELSPNYYAMLGYAEGEAPRGRQAWRSLVHPDDIAQLDANQLLPPNDARDHEHEFRIRAKDGSWRWFVSHFRVTDFDRFGRPAHLLGIDTDVTGRKQGELALQQAHERAQLYLDVAGVIIVVLDVNQRVTLLNRKGCEILGVSEEEALGRDWFEAFSPDAEREAQRATYAAFLAGGKGTMKDVEMTVRTRGRDVRLITWHDSLLHDETGAVIGCMSSGEDITEQRAVQGKRDEFRALIEATAQASPDGIVVIAPDGRYLFWNNRYREMWQLGEDYLRSRQAGRPLTADPLKPFMDQVTEPGSFREKSLDIQRGHLAALIFDEVLLRDGRIFVRHAARVSAGNPPVAAIAWIYRDVTEQRKRDAELAQSQRLTAVGQLSGGVAHELNNLLTVISGNLELIQGFADAKTRISELTTPALSAVERGSELTRGLLAFSRQQALAPQLTDVNALIPKVIKILPHLLGGDVRISFVSGIDLGETIVDPGQLETALINLATNARDALPTGGSLVIETGNRVVDEADREQFGEIPAGEYVVIAVTDNGLGMPPEVAKRAFEPFFTTKEVGKGTGLGLSMVFGFVKQSGGHVSLYSEQGAGTTVRVYLPRAPVGLVAGAKPSVCVVTQGDSQRILLVEDEPAVSAITRGFLESLGYRVIEARNGPEALAMLQRGDPVDLLLTDVMLPDGMNGAEVARAALTLRPDLKVLYYSGYTEEALIRQGRLEAGVVLLQKPFRRQDLAQAVSRVLSRSAAIPSLIRT
ncbi:MAG: hypothetical protein QOK29_2910, partial [Rhodospirillaceae bacterium]|nr:hypothetical protein [Rhodospirillaceae bacterium]